MNSNNFVPAVRFAVMSDIHLKDEPCVEEERFDKALKCAYKLAESDENYKSLDAVVVVGDFANKGSEIQMKKAKTILDNNINYNKTKVILSVASHEYMTDGADGAYKRLKDIFGSEPDNHEVINGFHFVSVSPSHSCNFNDEKKAWVANELKEAAKSDRKKPIFMFQHPHNTGTVFGSTLWGEDDLIAIYMNYPQIIDFSGHSHAPINDPRSVHQQHFTSFGTGTLSYFELDEFDKYYGTIPPDKSRAAQMLIVEADKDNRVRVYPYDVLTENFFPYEWKIDTPSDPSTFTYTDKRYKTAACPHFEKDAKAIISDITENSFKLELDQAKSDEEYVNSYDIIVKNKNDEIVKQLSIWSEYYFYDMPKSLSLTVDGLEPHSVYSIKITANSFWLTTSVDSLTALVQTK